MAKHKALVFVLIFTVVVLAFLFFFRKHSSDLAPVVSGASFLTNPQETLDRVSGILEGETFDVMIARTEAEQSLGLGGLAGLGPNEAMLFPYGVSDYYGFWMKGMEFSIDIAWLDENLSVIHFEKDVAPDSYPKIFFPRAPARFVAEFSAGTFDRLGVLTGSFFDIGKGL